MELLIDMMSCFEDDGRCTDGESELSTRHSCVPQCLTEGGDQCSRWSSSSCDSSATAGRVSPPLTGLSAASPARWQHHSQLCRRLSAATERKLSALDHEERLMRGERCLRRHVLVRNLSACLQRAARDEAHARRVAMATESQWRQRRKQRWLQRSTSLGGDDTSATTAPTISPAFNSTLPPSIPSALCSSPLVDNVSSFTHCRRTSRDELQSSVCVSDEDMSPFLEWESRDCDVSDLDYADCSPRSKRLCISSKSCRQAALESEVCQSDLTCALKSGRTSTAFSEVQQVSQHWLFTLE